MLGNVFFAGSQGTGAWGWKGRVWTAKLAGVGRWFWLGRTMPLPLPQFPSSPERIMQTVEITKHAVDIEEKGVRLRLTIVDTPGFGDAVNNTEWYV